ncbi:hypothetical protein TrVE_jg10176 [Triparma verrucosa]|uniref:Vesicle transport v-SNARE N-terminal domain-containing protein n=2 Tax=Triparma TaxID=722752 RepID=A0A9W6ZNU4_9STRA|nr:hypothetical protein TrST_g11890 [Triparma strigata]GMH84878.1 hypothetical protein TrVE_jg10176 [Triparma verrucosa]
MASQFANYSREITDLTASIRSFLASPQSSRSVSILITSKSSLDQCEAILSAMRVSVDDSTSASNRKALMGKVKRIGKELEALEEELKRESVRLDRSELFGSQTQQQNSSDPFDPFGAKLIDTMGSLNQTTSLLHSTQLLCSETEATGAHTLTTMGAQREQLENANRNVSETKTIAGQAKTVLRKMGRRAAMNKLFLYFVILCLVAANCAVIYYQFIKS